jgi:hypothetical protein
MGRHALRPLAPSLADTCNPLLQAHPTWARDEHEGRGFPLLLLSLSGFFPPSRSVSRRPIWDGARGDNLLVGPGTPRVRNADNKKIGKGKEKRKKEKELSVNWARRDFGPARACARCAVGE